MSSYGERCLAALKKGLEEAEKQPSTEPKKLISRPEWDRELSLYMRSIEKLPQPTCSLAAQYGGKNLSRLAQKDLSAA